MDKNIGKVRSGLLLGLGVGIAIGTATDNIAVGVGVGVALAVALSQRKTSDEKDLQDDDKREENSNQ